MRFYFRDCLPRARFSRWSDKRLLLACAKGRPGQKLSIQEMDRCLLDEIGKPDCKHAGSHLPGMKIEEETPEMPEEEDQTRNFRRFCAEGKCRLAFFSTLDFSRNLRSDSSRTRLCLLFFHIKSYNSACFFSRVFGKKRKSGIYVR